MRRTEYSEIQHIHKGYIKWFQLRLESSFEIVEIYLIWEEYYEGISFNLNELINFKCSAIEHLHQRKYIDRIYLLLQ